MAGVSSLSVDREDVCATCVCRPSVEEISGSTEILSSDDVDDWCQELLGRVSAPPEGVRAGRWVHPRYGDR
jgi:trans-2-enoyl-CoA reductase